ncbi:MAG: dihydroneopterin aldolase [Lacisediminimonas sp.]|nr:dihydroneopterin aldolase [Lacisediminimonas sp.]
MDMNFCSRAAMHPWRIEISGLATHSRVGIWEHELEPQPVRIDLCIDALAPAVPREIGDCIDYEPLYRWFSQEFPCLPHTPLLETRVLEIMAFVFRHDVRIGSVEVALFKPLAGPCAREIGVRTAMTRPEFGRLSAHQVDEAVAAG